MNITVPESIGQVSSTFSSVASDKFIIVIPCRVLDRYAFEKGVMRTLQYLIEQYQLKLAMPEGADGKLDVSTFRLPDTQIRSEMTDQFMREGKITGLEALMITTDYEIEARGIDDRVLYHQCNDLLRTSQAAISPFLQSIDRLQYQVTCLLRETAPKVDYLESATGKYATGEMQINHYFEYLADLASQVGISLETEYPAFFKAVQSLRNPYSHLYHLEAKILRDLLQGKEQEESQEDTITDPEDEIPHPKRAISDLVFAEDDSRLIRDLRMRLCDNDSSIELAKLANDLEILTRLTNMAGTPLMVAEFKKRRHEFGARYIADTLSRNDLSRHSIAITTEEIEIMDTAVPIMERFYELAIKRQNAFVKNAEKHMNDCRVTLSTMLITGYNVSGVLDILRERGISHCRVSVEEVKSDDPVASELESKQAYLVLLGGTTLTAPPRILSKEERQAYSQLFPEYAEHFEPWKELDAGLFKRTVQLRNQVGQVLALKIVDLRRLESMRELFQQKGYANPVDVFFEESKIMEDLNNLHNPHISRIAGYGVDVTNKFFLFLEQFSERTLKDYVETNPLSYEMIEDLAFQLADALASIHKSNRCHGDLHPGNILFRNGLFTVTDWDLASSLPGTRVDGSKPVLLSEPNQQTDVLQFGCNIVYAWTREMPRPGDASYEKVISDIPHLFRDNLLTVIPRCLTLNLNERFRDGQEVLISLQGLRTVK